MAMPPERSFVDAPDVVRLRMLHRCHMCRKHCQTPCKFTSLEFRHLLRDELDSPSRDAEDDGSRHTPVT
jgi:hypothetical protein